MIIKIKSTTTLDVPDEVMENIDEINVFTLIQEYATETQMEIVDENGEDFIEFGVQDVTEEVKEFSKNYIKIEDN